MRRRTAARSATGSSPSTRTSPALARASPSITSRVEVLPAPLTPSRAWIEPAAISRSIPRTASKAVDPEP